MSLDRELKVRGNLIPEGLVAPGSTSWPPDALDQQLHYKVPENQLYIYLSSYDAWFPVASPDTSSSEMVYSEFVKIDGSSFASVRTAFFNWWPNRSIGDWDTIYRHCWWRFADASNVLGTISTPQKFSTQNELFTFMEGYLPSGGGVYSANTVFMIYEKIDTADPFPLRIRHRNSIVAAVRGRGAWSRMKPAGTQWGVASSFNSGHYFLNFTNELGQRLVQAHLSVLPGTNNDSVVWHHRGCKTMWRWPRVGDVMWLYSGVSGRAVWDSVAGAWLSPAPAGSYTVLNPMFLEEFQSARLLSIETSFGPDHRAHELYWPSALAFPLVNAGRYYAFSLVPHGLTSFVTDNIDLGNYDLVLCAKYRHNFRRMYAPTPVPVSSSSQDSLWQLSPATFVRSPSNKPNVDTDDVPVQIDMARRNRSTGLRSPWVTLCKITRRINHAAFRVDPAAWKR